VQVAAVVGVLAPAGLSSEAIGELDNYLGKEAGHWSIEGIRGDPRIEPLLVIVRSARAGHCARSESISPLVTSARAFRQAIISLVSMANRELDFLASLSEINQISIKYSRFTSQPFDETDVPVATSSTRDGCPDF